MFTSRLSIAMTKLHLVEVLLSLLAHLRFLLVLGVATLHHLTFWRRLRYKEIPSYSLPLTDIILYGSTTNYKNPLVRYFWWHISLLSKRRRWRMFPSASSLRDTKCRSNLGGGDNHEIASLRSQRHRSKNKVCRILSNIVSPIYLNEITITVEIVYQPHCVKLHPKGLESIINYSPQPTP